MALSPKILISIGRKVWHNPIVSPVLRFSDFIPVENGSEAIVDRCRKHIKNGYSIAIFPEAERVISPDIGRFHNGAFMSPATYFTYLSKSKRVKRWKGEKMQPPQYIVAM